MCIEKKNVNVGYKEINTRKMLLYKLYMYHTHNGDSFRCIKITP